MNLLLRGLSFRPHCKNNNLEEKLSGGTELLGFSLLNVAWVLFTEGFCGYYKHWQDFFGIFWAKEMGMHHPFQN